MRQISVDLETLGTHVDSQILSIGACEFDIKTGDILREFYVVIDLTDFPVEQHLKVTPGTLDFWLNQPAEARDAIFSKGIRKVSELQAINELSLWLRQYDKEFEIWANGTKFDLGMLEESYREFMVPVPWKFNVDRCMRTLRKFAGPANINYNGIAHHALHDAIWQAKYISVACNKLGLN